MDGWVEGWRVICVNEQLEWHWEGRREGGTELGTEGKREGSIGTWMQEKLVRCRNCQMD